MTTPVNTFSSAVSLLQRDVFRKLSLTIHDKETFRKVGLSLMRRILTELLHQYVQENHVHWIYATFYSHRFNELLGFVVFPQSAFGDSWNKVVSRYPMKKKRARIFDLVNRHSRLKRPLVWVRSTQRRYQKDPQDARMVHLPEDLLIGEFMATTSLQLKSSLGDLEELAKHLSSSKDGKQFLRYLTSRFNNILRSDLRTYDPVSLILLCQRILLRRMKYYYCLPCTLCHNKPMNGLEIAVDAPIGESDLQHLLVLTDLLYSKFLAAEII